MQAAASLTLSSDKQDRLPPLSLKVLSGALMKEYVYGNTYVLVRFSSFGTYLPIIQCLIFVDQQ